MRGNINLVQLVQVFGRFALAHGVVLFTNCFAIVARIHQIGSDSRRNQMVENVCRPATLLAIYDALTKRISTEKGGTESLPRGTLVEFPGFVLLALAVEGCTMSLRLIVLFVQIAVRRPRACRAPRLSATSHVDVWH